MPRPKPRRILEVPLGAKTSLIDRARADVIVHERKPTAKDHRRWVIVKNKLGAGYKVSAS